MPKRSIGAGLSPNHLSFPTTNLQLVPCKPGSQKLHALVTATRPLALPKLKPSRVQNTSHGWSRPLATNISLALSSKKPLEAATWNLSMPSAGIVDVECSEKKTKRRPVSLLDVIVRWAPLCLGMHVHPSKGGTFFGVELDHFSGIKNGP